MELKDTTIINAPRERVYAALNDPDILRQCIPGCQSLEKQDDQHLEAVAAIKVGPVSAKFRGSVELTDLNPPESYTIVGEGKGGAAGFAKGRAEVKLTEEGPETTELAYDVSADVGGKLAQLGGRLLDSTAKKLSAQFFEKFKELVEAEGEPAEAPAAAEAAEIPPTTARAAAAQRTVPPAATTPPAAPQAGAMWKWVAIAAAVVVILVVIAAAM